MSMSESDLIRFARFIGQSVETARAIVAQEDEDKRKHPGRNVHNGYDYDRQEWVK